MIVDVRESRQELEVIRFADNDSSADQYNGVVLLAYDGNLLAIADTDHDITGYIKFADIDNLIKALQLAKKEWKA